MKKKLIIFGSGPLAQVAAHYFDQEEKYENKGFCLNDIHIREREIFGRPVFPFEDLQKVAPPDDFELFLAIGYSKMNRLREKKFNEAKDKGYTLASYVSPAVCRMDGTLPSYGENTLLLGGNYFAPFAKL